MIALLGLKSTQNSPFFRLASPCVFAAMLGLLLACGPSLSPNQRFGEAPESLSPAAIEYRHYLLSQVLEDNKCPKGFAPIQGQWRVSQPQVPQQSRDEIYFRGKEFTQFIASENENAKEYTIRNGSYACVDRNKLVFLVESVDPEGSFGLKSKDIYPCQVYWNPMTKGDTFALLCSFDWNPAESVGYSLQRVGF